MLCTSVIFKSFWYIFKITISNCVINFLWYFWNAFIVLWTLKYNLISHKYYIILFIIVPDNFLLFSKKFTYRIGNKKTSIELTLSEHVQFNVVRNKESVNKILFFVTQSWTTIICCGSLTSCWFLFYFLIITYLLFFFLFPLRIKVYLLHFTKYTLNTWTTLHPLCTMQNAR